MRKILLCTSMTVLALSLAFELRAEASVNYSADQSVSRPPAEEAAVTADSVVEPEAPDASTTATRPATTPIKSSKSTRPKWKALLPGTIK